MHFKLIIAMVEDEHTDRVLDAARRAGATGATVVEQARGEGMVPAKTFFGLDLDSNRDLILFLVEEHLSRRILEHIARVGRFDEERGNGIAVQIDVEDAVGVVRQTQQLRGTVEDEL